jgi:hypothetical protein
MKIGIIVAVLFAIATGTGAYAYLDAKVSPSASSEIPVARDAS